MSVLQRYLPLNDHKVVLKSFETNWDGMEETLRSDILSYNIPVSKSDIEKCNDVLPVIVFISGHCALLFFKKVQILKRFGYL